MQTQIESHLKLALRGLEATQHQVHELVTVVKDQSQQTEQQSQQIERQSQQIERQSQQIEILMFNDKEQSEKMVRLMSKVQDQSQQIKRLISEDKERSKKMERSMSTVQDQPLQTGRRGPINQIFPTSFEWKVPSIAQICRKATCEVLKPQNIVSKPFYLLERSYKYLLEIETSSTLPVYIKVVRGEFDESLSWPCKEKVRVTLIDQEPQPVSKNHMSQFIDFEKGREPCSEPLHDDYHECRFIYSLPRNIQYGSYTKDDTILIRVNRE